jgi:hypothetical protein
MQEADFFLTAYVEVFTFTYARFKPGSRFLLHSLCRSLHFYIIMPVSNQEVEYHRVNLYRCLHFVLSCFKWGGWVVLLSFIVDVRLSTINVEISFSSSIPCHLNNIGFMLRFMVFNATFNNISVTSWRSVLLVEETGVPGKNHRPVGSNCQTLYHILFFREHLAMSL